MTRIKFMLNSRLKLFFNTLTLVLVLFCTVSLRTNAESENLHNSQINGEALISLSSSNIDLKPGEIKTVNLIFTLPSGFHAYSDQFFIANVTDEIQELIKVKDLKIHPEVEFFDKFKKKTRKGIFEKGEISFQIEASNDLQPKPEKLNLEIKYQICSEQVCYFPKTKKIILDINQKINNLNNGENNFILDNLSYFSVEKNLSDHLLFTFIIVFLAGILTSFTPCIFPMIPITISILGHQSSNKKSHFLRSLFYVLGIALTYASLGVLAAATGSLFGQALSNQYVILSLVIIFILMALSMWGVFEIQVPAFIRNKLGTGQSRSHFEAFVMGLVAGVVASPCVGPVLISILSFVSTTQNLFLGFSLLFVYALGLGMIFILIGSSSRWINQLPKSGPWMNIVKFLLGFTMLLMALYFGRLLIPPDKLNTFEKIYRGPIDQSKKNDLWLDYSELNRALSKNENKPVLLDFYADWCAACLELDKKTYTHPEFLELAKSFILIKIDATRSTPEIEKILKQYNIKGLPTVLFLNTNGKIIPKHSFTQFLEWNQLKPKMKDVLENSKF